MFGLVSAELTCGAPEVGLPRSGLAMIWLGWILRVFILQTGQQQQQQHPTVVVSPVRLPEQEEAASDS